MNEDIFCLKIENDDDSSIKIVNYLKNIVKEYPRYDDEYIKNDNDEYFYGARIGYTHISELINTLLKITSDKEYKQLYLTLTVWYENWYYDDDKKRNFYIHNGEYTENVNDWMISFIRSKKIKKLRKL